MKQIFIVVCLFFILLAISSCKSQDHTRIGMEYPVIQNTTTGRARTPASQYGQESYKNSAEKAYMNQVRTKSEELKRAQSNNTVYTEASKDRQVLNQTKENGCKNCPTATFEKRTEKAPHQQPSTTVATAGTPVQAQTPAPSRNTVRNNDKQERYVGPFANMLDDVIQSNAAHQKGDVYPTTSTNVQNSSKNNTYNDLIDNNPVRTESITYLSEYDRISMKKYNVVIASLGRYDNAVRLRNTLLKEGEQVTIVKGQNGMHRVIVGSFDTEEEAKRKIQSIGLYYRAQYTTAQLQQTYGIPFSHLWILVN